MKRQTLLIVLAVLAVIVIAGVGLALTYVQSLTSLPPLTIRFSTAQTLMPEGAVCAGGREDSPGVAKEILNLENNVIYVAGGTNPMPDDVWAETHFRLPLLQNSTRNLMFDGSCFFRSPGADPACEEQSCFIIEELVGYTWLALNDVVGQECFPDPNGCSGDVVNPGYVSITTIDKCQRIVYDGLTIYELRDDVGNAYVMHATATGTPDLFPTLPTGWTLTERQIEAPLVLLPAGASEACYYNIVRDNLVQSYHQFIYAEDQYPPQ